MIYNILIIILLVIVKAIFSAGDTALMYVNKAKISQLSKRDKKAKKMKTLINENTKFYGVIELAITLIELLASAFAAETFVKQFMHDFIVMNIDYEVSEILAILIVTVILSYVLLIFGGILPRKIARNNPEKVAFKIVNLLWFLSKLTYPFEKLITGTTNIVSKIFKIPDKPKENLTEKEIKLIIREGKEQGIIEKVEKDILFNTLKFNEISVKQITTPKEKVDMIEISEDKEKVMNKIKKYKFTRIPIYKDRKDNILGMLNIKDIILQCNLNEKFTINFENVIRPIIKVNESEKISTIFKQMQANSQSIAIVIDSNRLTI